MMIGGMGGFLLIALLWFTPRFTTVQGFVVSVSHFVERHGLVVIVALGESIVVIGTGAAGLALDADLVLVALLSLSLSAALWRIYFSDEDAVERALHGTAPQRRAQPALTGFGYWHYGILLGIIAVAAGLNKAIGHPLRHPRALDRPGARSRHRPLHRLRHRLRAHLRDQTKSHPAAGGGHGRAQSL
jgi:low temperature requirement protein LtrA